jgi:hypothetical protein
MPIARNLHDPAFAPEIRRGASRPCTPACACRGVHRSLGPRAGQTARPGTRKGPTTNEAAVGSPARPELGRTHRKRGAAAGARPADAVVLLAAAAAFAVPAAFGLRSRCQRCRPIRHSQGLAMVASLRTSRSGSVKASRRVQTRDSTPAAWRRCSAGGMPYSSERNSCRYRQRCSDGRGARRCGPPDWPTGWAGLPGRSPGTPSGQSWLLPLGSQPGGPSSEGAGEGRPG